MHHAGERRLERLESVRASHRRLRAARPAAVEAARFRWIAEHALHLAADDTRGPEPPTRRPATPGRAASALRAVSGGTR